MKLWLIYEFTMNAYGFMFYDFYDVDEKNKITILSRHKILKNIN